MTEQEANEWMVSKQEQWLGRIAASVSPGSNARRFARAASELRNTADHYKYRGRLMEASNAIEAAETLDALATKCAACDAALTAERIKQRKQADAAQAAYFAELRAKYLNKL